MREFAVNYGRFLDTAESAQHLDGYRFGPEYAYRDYKGGEDGISGYTNFNGWFSRTFKSIDRQRPVAEPDNPRVIAFPAESTFVGQWPICRIGENPAAAEATITVKHVAWPIGTLLKDSGFATAFEGGTMIQSFLNVNNYHRQHAPTSGTMLEARFIRGHVYMDVSLDQVNITGKETECAMNGNQSDHQLEADDPTGFQFLHCRSFVVLQTAVG
jgi:phosphatidylserine decarboxylase